MKKADIRALIAEQKKNFRQPEALSAAIAHRLQTLDVFRAAQAIGVYMPLSDEVDITPLFQLTGKRFFIPAFDETFGLYRMAQLTPELKKGCFGIFEPANPAFAAKDELALILVPGIAFDRKGRRIGRGGGFYDRLLPQYDAPRVGVCFDFQLLETIPAEEHDIQMSRIVTETQIIKVYDER